jgi:sugar/nucleoside kinase (ribokinase family)
MSNSLLAARAADFLGNNAAQIPSSPSLVGLDGFVDTILHVVATRQSADSYTRLASMAEFGGRISAAAGLSANFEMVTQMVKLGGNGPIMANALGAYGSPVTYVGNLGSPNIHPVFADFAARAEVISLAEPGYTDAFEFDDGKLMFGKHGSLREVNWNNLTAHVPVGKMAAKFENAALVALVNWTMLTGMTHIFEQLLEEVMPKLKKRTWMFFDLADPAKRTREDIATVLGLIARFQEHANVILGLNLQEGRQIGEVLGFPACEETHEAVAAHAVKIREKLGVNTVVIHPVAFAAAADETGSAAVQGPYIEKPKITTGAGDHFNAGFCIGRVLGAPVDVSLQIGVGTSGFYVRTAKSPTAADMVEFLRGL